MTAPVVSVPEKFLSGLDFTTTALADGSLLAVYTRTIPGGGYQIVKQFLNADGTLRTGPQVIFSQTTGEHREPVAARLSDGRFVVAWTSDDSGVGNSVIKYQIFRSDGYPSSAVMTMGNAADGLWNPQITALANGAFTISYEQIGSLRNAFFSATGDMSQDVALGPSAFGSPDIATLKNGNSVTVASVPAATGGLDVFAYIRTPNGDVTAQKLFNASGVSDPEVTVLSNGNFVVLWNVEGQAGTTLKAHVYDQDGNPLGEDISLGDTMGEATVKALANGDFVVAYSRLNETGGIQSAELCVATYSASGALVGEAAVVQSGLPVDDIDPSLEVMNDGRYVLSYSKGCYQIFDPRPGAVYWTGTSGSEQYGGTHYSDKLKAESGNDRFYGFGGNDYLDGGSGNDVINGGLGKDTLYGRSGKDAFVFDVKATSSNRDKIVDYSTKYDTIHLENAVFTKLKAGKLSSSAFWKGSSAHDKNDRIIYDANKGYLYYDADGTGSSKKMLIATMTKKLKMTHAEFFVI